MVITVETSDGVIWNRDQVIMAICTAMHNQETLTISLNREGPDVRAVGLEDLIVEASICFDYNLAMVQFDDDCNLLQNSVIATNYSAPMQFVQSIQEHMTVNPQTVLKNIGKHFGMFIGREAKGKRTLRGIGKPYLTQRHHDLGLLEPCGL